MEKVMESEKSIERQQLDEAATLIANATVSAVKAAALLMPDEIHRYKQQHLLETVIAKLNESY